MREELVSVGFNEFKTADDVAHHLSDHKGTTLLVINSVCGCAAGSARPGIKWAVENNERKPEVLATVFAGVDKDAVSKVREFYRTLPSILSFYCFIQRRRVGTLYRKTSHRR